MPEPPDLADLAKRYLDLWQDQLIAMAADPELAEGMARLLGALVPRASPLRGGAFGHETTAPAGAAAARAAPSHGDERLAELARRLAAIEERLAAVEAGTRGGGTETRGKRRRGSA